MSSRFRPALLLAMLGTLLGGTPLAATAADAYPSAKPVRLIVPFPPGGSTDIVARFVTPKFAEKLGQTVFIDNRGGASGMIGTTEAARAEPDGYTLLIVFDSHATNHHLYKNLKYDPFKSFDYITLMTTSPVLLATAKSFAPNTVPELIAFGKAHPGEVTYGSSGTGTSNHLNALSFADQAGIVATHVPYRGGGPMTVAVTAGEVNYVVGTVGGMLQQVKTGQLKALGVGSKERIAQLPNTPTISEFLPGYEANSWIGLMAPAGLPKDVLNKIHKAMVEALADPEVHDKLTSNSFEVIGSTPAFFLDKVRHESDTLGKLIQSRGIKVE
jgi:tripartite-type tricarboxylate transporter receptor subunit TctC